MGPITKFKFSKSKRLRTPKDFKDVFQKSTRSASVCFSVLSRCTDIAIPRIGIIVAKKTISRAVKRNTIRRMVRESFRFHQQNLAGLDIVVLVRSAVTSQSKTEIRLCLEKHWKELALRSAKA
jgi:ribonuclease P protein component